MESIFDRRIKHLISVIDSYGAKPFNLKELVAYYTYDLMGELIFNAEFGSMAAQDPNKLPPINEHIFLGCMYGMLPSLLPYSMQLAPHIPLPWLQHLLKSRKALRDQTSKHVAAELAKDKDQTRHNILARLMEARDPETGEELTEAQISSEAFAFLVAGSHTTSGTLTLLFYHLLHNSVSSKRLTEELTVSLPLPSPDDESLPAYSGLEMQLPYATACIRENYRISPVFTMPLPRTVIEPGGAIIDGYHVPQGVSRPPLSVFSLPSLTVLQANVAIVNEVLQHNASIWGEDHDTFRPERWLDTSNKLSPNDLLPFGAGHRACIGRNIANMSVTKVLTTLWRRYDLEAVDPTEKLVVETVGIGEKEGPLMVTAKLRAQ